MRRMAGGRCIGNIVLALVSPAGWILSPARRGRIMTRDDPEEEGKNIVDR